MQKIFKTGTILFWEKHVIVQLSKQLPKLDETMDQSETLLCSSPKTPHCLPRSLIYHDLLTQKRSQRRSRQRNIRSRRPPERRRKYSRLKRSYVADLDHDVTQKFVTVFVTFLVLEVRPDRCSVFERLLISC